MPLPYPKQEANSRDRAKHLLRGVPKADTAQDRTMIRSAIKQHDDQLHGGKPTKLKLASGGVADGAAASARMDRAPRARGGKAGKGKKATHVNVVVNAGKQDADMPMGGLAAAAPPGLPSGPPAMPPSPPPMPPKPMGPMPGGPMPMPMRARGGRAPGGGVDPTDDGKLEAARAKLDGLKGAPSDLDLERYRQQFSAIERGRRARGGKAYDAGAGTGEGRLTKVENYGANAKIKDTTKAVKGPKGEARA